MTSDTPMRDMPKLSSLGEPSLPGGSLFDSTTPSAAAFRAASRLRQRFTTLSTTDRVGALRDLSFHAPVVACLLAAGTARQAPPSEPFTRVDWMQRAGGKISHLALAQLCHVDPNLAPYLDATFDRIAAETKAWRAHQPARTATPPSPSERASDA